MLLLLDQLQLTASINSLFLVNTCQAYTEEICLLMKWEVHLQFTVALPFSVPLVRNTPCSFHCMLIFSSLGSKNFETAISQKAAGGTKLKQAFFSKISWNLQHVLLSELSFEIHYSTTSHSVQVTLCWQSHFSTIMLINLQECQS